ncbi:MAG: ribosomal RNA small subunit methyltransferase A [Leptospira sp.]|nr:ribosomal RNA small subunit methyltransferase A [Leptospira sp.]
MPDFPYFSPKKIQEVLAEHGASPRKSWGQNYLIDRNTIDQVFANFPGLLPEKTTHIAEIGIGLGAFTHKILSWDLPTSLFEIDPISCRIYREGLGNLYPNVKLYEGDFLKNYEHIQSESIFLFGNLPYYITSEIILLCLLQFPRLTGFLFMAQKEFADRITQESSSLSALINGFGEVRKYRTIRSACFYPQPKIDSTLIFFEAKQERLGRDPLTLALFSLLLRVSFWGKRKKLSTAFREAPWESFLTEEVLALVEKEFLLSQIGNFQANCLIHLEKIGWQNLRPDALMPQDFLNFFQNVQKISE